MNIKTLLTFLLLLAQLLSTPSMAISPSTVKVAEYNSMIQAKYASLILSVHSINVASETLQGFAGIESLYGLRTKNRYTRATGVMQIVPSTRKYLLHKYKWVAYQPESTLKEYVLGGVYLDYISKYYSKYGVKPTPANLYLGYLLGPWYGVKTVKDVNKKHPRHMSKLISRKSYRNNRSLLNRSSKSLLDLVSVKLSKFK